MKELRNTMASPREQLLEKLRLFELAAKPLHPSYRGPGAWKEWSANLHHATEDMRLFLAEHPAPRELMDWRELPDSDAEITAFAHELKLEHADLQRELGDLLGAVAELETALDRHEAASQIYDQTRNLAQRIARHAGGEEAQLGRYS